MKKKISLALILLLFAFVLNVKGYNPENLNSTAFAYYSIGTYSCTLFKFNPGSPSVVSVIGSLQHYFLGAGDWANPAGTWNFYVAATIDTPFVFQVDTLSGALTKLGYITGLNSGHRITLMEWDIITNKFYLFSINNSSTISQFYSLNWSTKTATPIGGPNITSPAISGGGFTKSGTLYVIDNYSQNFFRINKTTGLPTLIGPLGFPPNAADGVAIDRSDGKLYITSNPSSTLALRQYDSTLNNGVQVGLFPYYYIWAMCIVSVPSTGINIISSETPSSYKLFQNYPNPFNHSTNIKFEIREPCFTTLKVYNSIGKEVASLVNEYLEAGEYETMFDGEKLSSGLYFYKITADNFTDTKKMILIK